MDISPYVRQSGPANFCLWNPELRALEIQNSAQGIRNPADGGNLEPSSYSNIESEIPGLESRIHSIFT